MYKYNTPVYRAESLHRKRDASAEGRTFAAYKKTPEGQAQSCRCFGLYVSIIYITLICSNVLTLYMLLHPHCYTAQVRRIRHSKMGCDVRHYSIVGSFAYNSRYWA